MRLQRAARNSMEWFEHVARYEQLDAEQFAYALLTRSQRVSHENLRLRDRDYVDRARDAWFAPPARPAERTARAARRCSRRSGCASSSSRTASWCRRCRCTARSRACPTTSTSCTTARAPRAARPGGHGDDRRRRRDGRITPGCAGIWNDEQAAAWKRIVDYVHDRTPAQVRAAARARRAEGRHEARVGGRERAARGGRLAAHRRLGVPWTPANQVPRAMTRADMDAVTEAYRRGDGARRVGGLRHGSSCTSPTATCSRASSRRSRTTAPTSTAAALENRLRYPLEVFAAVRARVPRRPSDLACASRRPTGSAHAGVTGDDAVEIGDAFAAAGADVIDISAGQTSTRARPIYGRMFQTPLADQIRNEARIATMAVGNITEPDHVNSIIMAGRADLCCLGAAAPQRSELDAARGRRARLRRRPAGPIRTFPAASRCAGSRAAPPRWPCGSDGPAGRAACPRHGGGLRHRAARSPSRSRPEGAQLTLVGPRRRPARAARSGARRRRHGRLRRDRRGGGRAARRECRPRGPAREQRRRRRVGAARAHRPRALAADARRQRNRRVPALPRVRARHDRARHGPGRERRVARRASAATPTSRPTAPASTRSSGSPARWRSSSPRPA